VNSFFDELATLWVDAARIHGAEIEKPALDMATSAELLELARVAARAQERRYAPLVCYLAGVAAERLRAAGSTTPLVEYIHRVRSELESKTGQE
jgi:hypothetical protein